MSRVVESLFISGLFALGACQNQKPEALPEAAKDSAQPSEPVAKAADTPKGTAASPGSASIGKPAPDFTLADLEGKPTKLADLKGKTVVLEWFNPECPFVKLSHTKGSLKGLAKKYAAKEDVVWLAINSGGEGRQGYGVDKNRAGVQAFGLEHPVLMDPEGSVGQAYGATNTPHMFVIDPQGVLIYSGAIDNSPDGEGQSPSGDKLVNYVSQALDELAARKPVSVPKTKAYGCSVKYAKG